MLSTRVFGLACAVTVFVCLLAAPVSAQPLDKRTLFTFSGPVALPGVTLPEGQYLFRLADPNSSSKVVQVLNADGTKPYGLFFTIAAERLEPASSPEVRFMETASGKPAAIRTWWYPGERRGYEFIFPREQARRLAMGATQPVLTTDDAGGPLEFVRDGETGFVVPPQPEALGAALRLAWDRTEALEKLGHRGLALASQLSWDATIARLLSAARLSAP